MRHILGNKVLEYDVDDRGVIVDEREIDRTINLNPDIPDVSIWIKQHMVFWYDMSKPVDVYVPGVTYANPFVNGGGKLTYDKTINKCIITHPGFYLAGDNVNDVDCNIVVEEIPTKQSVPTNEILKANPYLQDFSGNNRRLKLNNFLFAAMSGVGGYELNWTDQSIWSRSLGSRFNGTIEQHKLTVTSVLNSATIIETIVPSYAKKFKVKVSGVIDEIVAYI